jgi:hypothetical protein
MTGVSPSYLLHPLDLLGGDKVASWRSSPAWTCRPGSRSISSTRCSRPSGPSFHIVTLEEHARDVEARRVTSVRRVREELALG